MKKAWGLWGRRHCFLLCPTILQRRFANCPAEGADEGRAVGKAAGSGDGGDAVVRCLQTALCRLNAITLDIRVGSPARAPLELARKIGA